MTVDTSHRATRENGPSVVNGRLVWTSATGITTADPNSFGGCFRKFHYDFVQGLKGPPTKSMLAGTGLHSEVEDHLRTGASLTSPLALSGRMFIPHPGSGLHIEKPIHFNTRVGVSIFGHVDLYNLRQQYLDSDGVLQQDPPWSFEVKDWKTTSSFEYAKSERELAENIQLTTYAEAGFRLWTDLERARLTHVYFRTRGRPEAKLVTIMRDRSQIETRWEYAESVVRSMVDVAKETVVDKVPANLRACSAYNGCPHRNRCSAAQFNSLESLYSKIATDFVKEPDVGILANNPQIMQPTASAAPAQPDMRQQLAAEEAQMRAQQQQAQQAQVNTQQLAVACQRINAHGRGFPAVGGNAAQPYAQTIGATQPVQPGFVFTGIGNLGGLQINEVAHFFQLADELDAQRQAPPAAAQVQQALVQPIVYNQQTQQYTTPQGTPLTTQPVIGPPQAGGFLPPDAPVSQPQLAAAQPKAQPQSPEQIVQFGEAPADEKPARRGRPKKDKNQDASPGPVAAEATPTPPISAPASQAAPVNTSTSETGACAGSGMVLVNARCEAVATKSLAGYVDYINEKLAKMYNTTSDGKQGPLDVRMAVEDSILGYGGWKGAVRTVVQADPPPAGNYHFDTFMNELNEIVADALRVVAERNGWLYVRGTR